jgi:DNA (cytosine-5)-methyltransferase 1
MARFVSLFAGVGGFDLGLEQSGHTCVGQVEIDKNARAILERHWPNAPKHDDVQTAIDWANENGLTGTVDLVVGGFPCQDLSVAGKRAGLAGKRSGLFFDALAFAQSVKAKTILLENVPGLLSSNQGRDFGQLLTELANAGYSNIEWRVLNSQFFGVAQRRRRVFIVASVGTEPFKQILAEREGSAGDSSQSQPQGQDTAGTVADGTGAGRRGGIGSDLVGALCASDYKFPQQQQVMENKVVIQQASGQSSFGGFTEGITTLTATDYKRPEQNVVVRQES